MFLNHSSTETFLIVGLGNPGEEYAMTRHNCGFQTIDILSQRWSAPCARMRCHGKVSECRLDGQRLVLCQPQTMMNASGECVAALLQWYKCPPDHLLVIYDDIDLPTGRLRLRKSGSGGTHNGMRSILTVLPHGDFPRLRIGIGAPPQDWDLVRYVLGQPSSAEEAQIMTAAFARAADVVEDLLKNGIDHAMQLANRQVEPEILS